MQILNMSVITERSINAIPESLRQKTVHGKSLITETIASPKPLGYLVDLKKKKNLLDYLKPIIYILKQSYSRI